LTEIVNCSDEEFCKKYGVPAHVLNKMKRARPNKPEKDELWVYTGTK
jgi:hypothetical protein